MESIQTVKAHMNVRCIFVLFPSSVQTRIGIPRYVWGVFAPLISLRSLVFLFQGEKLTPKKHRECTARRANDEDIRIWLGENFHPPHAYGHGHVLPQRSYTFEEISP